MRMHHFRCIAPHICIYIHFPTVKLVTRFRNIFHYVTPWTTEAILYLTDICSMCGLFVMEELIADEPYEIFVQLWPNIACRQVSPERISENASRIARWFIRQARKGLTYARKFLFLKRINQLVFIFSRFTNFLAFKFATFFF